MDFAILNFIQQLRTPFFDWLMPCITFLGDNGLVWILLTLILLCIKKTRRTGLLMAASLLLGLLVGNIILKPLVARARPFSLEPLELLIAAPLDYSFPSGHTLSSFAAASSLFLTNKKAGVPALVLAALITFSRLYLYVHFPSDVLAGLILGLLCGFLPWYLLKRATK